MAVPIGHTCWFRTCVIPAAREYNGNYYCAHHYVQMIKSTVVEKYDESTKKKEQDALITVDFCIWLQDTDVFSAFTDHLNKGMKLEEFGVNNPKTLKAKA